MGDGMTQEEALRELDRIRKLPWTAIFHKTIDNPIVPGGKVDAYILIDDDSGEGIVSVGVPHGQRWFAEYIASCCADPHFVRHRPYGDTAIAIAFNRALGPFIANGEIDGREVVIAATAIF